MTGTTTPDDPGTDGGPGRDWWTPQPPPTEQASRGRSLSRRRFLGLAAGALAVGGAGAGVWEMVGRSTGPASAPSAARLRPAGAGPLVLVVLYGGNDGLNTVVPYQDPLYAQLRGTLAVPASQVLPIGEGMGLHPKLAGLKSLWDAGHLAVVRGVGYPDPVLSHFASMAVWQSGSLAAEAAATGWIGRWLDTGKHDPLRAVAVGPTLPLLLMGQTTSGAAVPEGSTALPGGSRLQQAFSALNAPDRTRSSLAAYAAESGRDLLGVQAAVTEALGRAPAPTATTPAGGTPSTTTPAGGTPRTATRAGGRPAATTPSAQGDNPLAAQLDLVSRLIRGGLPTEVYVVSLNGFDNHAAETGTHDRLLGQLDQAVAPFLRGLAGDPRGRGTVVMTTSEFGRRVAPNASGGTDHGTAAPVLVAGSVVRGGVYGEEPSLARLDDGNLRYTTDFRQVCATVLERLLGTRAGEVIQGNFALLPFL